MEWWQILIPSVATFIAGIAGTWSLLYQRYETTKAQAVKDAILARRESIENERIGHNVDAEQLTRAIKARDDLYDLAQQRWNEQMTGLDSRICEMESESDKRQKEHIQCQIDNALMKKDIESLTKENNLMRDRIAKLEARP